MQTHPPDPLIAPRPTGLRWGRATLWLALAAVVLFALWWFGVVDGLLSGEIGSQQVWGQFNTATTIFLGIFIEAAAFLLLGVLMSAIIQVFVTTEMLDRWIPHNRLGATVTGALMGLIFPVCECGSVPAARRLISKGAPVSLGVSFLLAAPVINPIVILSTWEAFGGDPWIVGGRVGLTLIIAITIGLVISLHPAAHRLLTPATAQAVVECACCAPTDEPRRLPEKLRAVASHSATEFFEMGQFVVLGAALAALAQTAVPQEVLLQIGASPITSVLAMMALAVILSICSTVDAFVALGFATTFNTGAILAFLVYGPMIDIKAVLLFTTTFKKHAVALIVLLATLLSLLGALWINLNVG